MAHGDYDCCAICDRKMAYNPYADSKDVVCVDCGIEFFTRTGKRVTTGESLTEWIAATVPEVVRDVLTPDIYRTCCYSNPVDEAVKGKIGKP